MIFFFLEEIVDIVNMVGIDIVAKGYRVDMVNTIIVYIVDMVDTW